MGFPVAPRTENSNKSQMSNRSQKRKSLSDSLYSDENPRLAFEDKEFTTEKGRVLEVFHVSGDYIVALTSNKLTSDYYLELFNFDNLTSIDSVKIYTSCRVQVDL